MNKPRLGLAGIKWLKAIHIILSLVWLGGAISMNVLRFAWTPSANADLYAVDHAIVVIDHWVIIPAAFGALLSGLLESWLTTWGFFKYRWVTVKWIVTVVIMLYGPLFTAGWAREIESISKAEGLLALQNPIYLQDRWLYALSGQVMIIAMAALTIISVFKPWMKKAKATRPALEL